MFRRRAFGGPIPGMDAADLCLKRHSQSIARASPRSTAPYTDGIDRLAGTPVEDEGGLIEEPGTLVKLPCWQQVSSPSQRSCGCRRASSRPTCNSTSCAGLAREVDYHGHRDHREWTHVAAQ